MTLRELFDNVECQGYDVIVKVFNPEQEKVELTASRHSDEGRAQMDKQVKFIYPENGNLVIEVE